MQCSYCTISVIAQLALIAQFQCPILVIAQFAHYLIFKPRKPIYKHTNSNADYTTTKGELIFHTHEQPQQAWLMLGFKYFYFFWEFHKCTQISFFQYPKGGHYGHFFVNPTIICLYVLTTLGVNWICFFVLKTQSSCQNHEAFTMLLACVILFMQNMAIML